MFSRFVGMSALFGISIHQFFFFFTSSSSSKQYSFLPFHFSKFDENPFYFLLFDTFPFFFFFFFKLFFLFFFLWSVYLYLHYKKEEEEDEPLFLIDEIQTQSYFLIWLYFIAHLFDSFCFPNLKIWNPYIGVENCSNRLFASFSRLNP